MKNKYIAELLKLIQENPDLPVIPMVDGEAVCDDSGYWVAAWGKAVVEEYISSPRRGDMLFESDDDVFDTLEKWLSAEEFEKLPETESECRQYFDKLPWKKAILVYIDPAESEEWE